MKKNEVFDALSEIDGDLISEAGKEPGKPAKAINMKRRAWIIAVAAVLLTLSAAALIVGGALLAKKGLHKDFFGKAETPIPATIGDPGGSNANSSNGAPRFILEGETAGIKDDGGMHKDRLLYVGMRAVEAGGKPYLIIYERSLYDPSAQNFVPDGDAHEYLPRYYNGGAEKDGVIYFTGGITGCIPEGTAYESPGIFTKELPTGEMKPLIVSQNTIGALAIRGDVLYFAEYDYFGYSDRVYNEDGSLAWEGAYKTAAIYAADLKAKTISLVCKTGCRGVDFLAALDDGLWIMGSLDSAENRKLLKISYEDGNEQVFDLPDLYAKASELDGKLYLSVGAYGGRSALWEVSSNGEMKLLLDDNADYPNTLRAVGSDHDRPTFYMGKLVAVRAGTLLLIDTATGAETVLQTGVCLEPAAGEKSIIGYDGRFTKTVTGEELWFYDALANELYVFSGEALRFRQTVDYTLRPAED